MSENHAIGFMFMLTGGIGYLVFGWIGVWGGLLAAGFLSAGRYLKQRRCCSQTEGLARFRLGRRRKNRLGRQQSARLEALLGKAHLLAETFHDAYGARNCCLEIIRQTDKEDPLFLAAFDLFMNTVAASPRCRPVLTDRSVSSLRPFDPKTVPPAGANVIPFPFSASRH